MSLPDTCEGSHGAIRGAEKPAGLTFLVETVPVITWQLGSITADSLNGCGVPQAVRQTPFTLVPDFVDLTLNLSLLPRSDGLQPISTPDPRDFFPATGKVVTKIMSEVSMLPRSLACEMYVPVQAGGVVVVA
jgi:hypothetical protein